MISNELILAGKLQLKKLQSPSKPEFFSGFFFCNFFNCSLPARINSLLLLEELCCSDTSDRAIGLLDELELWTLECLTKVFNAYTWTFLWITVISGQLKRDQDHNSEHTKELKQRKGKMKRKVGCKGNSKRNTKAKRNAEWNLIMECN